MRLLRSIALLLLAAIGARAGAPTPELAARMAASPMEPVRVLAFLKETEPPVVPDSARRAIAALKRRAHSTQGPLLSALRVRRAVRVRALWAVNAVAFEAPPSVVRAIAARPEVAWVREDPLLPGLGPEPAAAAAGTPSWNIERVFAPAVWAEGFRGEGVVVGVMDTGVDAAHPALAGKMAPGGWFDAVNGKPAPYDDNGHGTHVTGSIVGGDVDGTAIGVAPGATYMAAKAIDAAKQIEWSWILAAGQWFLDPNGDGDPADAPDIINCSWAFNLKTESGYHAMLQLWRSAGILPVFAIGNSGPSPGSALSPGTDPLVVGVGMTNSSDVIGDASGRGPAPSVSPFNGILKPDLVAPGVLIGSARRGGGITYMSGTSMASPHVAGALALLCQRYPGISFADAWYRLTASALDLGAAGPDNVYGYGLLNIYAAIHLTGIPGDANGDGLITPADTALALAIAGGLKLDKAAVPRADIAAPTGRIDVLDAVAILRRWSGL